MLDSCAEVARPILFGIGIIITVYLPVLTLEGVEGKMFRPMALTVVFALVGSLVLTFLLTPVLIALFLRGELRTREPWLMERARRLYGPMLDWALEQGRRMALGAMVLVAIAGIAVPFLGSEFMPQLDEGAIALQVMRLPSVSLDESVRQTSLLERHLLERFPDELLDIVSKTGRAEIATDPMGVHISDVIVTLKPEREWKRARSKFELEEQMAHELDEIPGMVVSLSQPIELRVNELLAGVRSDVAIKIYGDDLHTLEELAGATVAAVSRIPGATGFRAQQLSGLGQLQITVLPAELARYGLSSAEVMRTIEALGGIRVSTVLEGQRRFALAVRLPENERRNIESIAALRIDTPGGARVPLGEVAKIEEIQGPADISHENGSRLVIVEGNVRGRDIGSFINEVEGIFRDEMIQLPSGYWIGFGGQFENLERGSRRLMQVVPLSLALIFLLLFGTFNSLRQATLVFTGIPLAAVGGIFALLLRGMPFSISAGVGFIALFGIAVLNGLVMVTFINQLRAHGRSLEEAIREGAVARLRPVLMTALVAALGFLPMALSRGAGAEVQQPLATVVIGGLITATVLTLLLLPVLYREFESRCPPAPIRSTDEGEAVEWGTVSVGS